MKVTVKYHYKKININRSTVWFVKEDWKEKREKEDS